VFGGQGKLCTRVLCDVVKVLTREEHKCTTRLVQASSSCPCVACGCGVRSFMWSCGVQEGRAEVHGGWMLGVANRYSTKIERNVCIVLLQTPQPPMLLNAGYSPMQAPGPRKQGKKAQYSHSSTRLCHVQNNANQQQLRDIPASNYNRHSCSVPCIIIPHIVVSPPRCCW
jgi:hypothetical protein